MPKLALLLALNFNLLGHKSTNSLLSGMRFLSRTSTFEWSKTKSYMHQFNGFLELPHIFSKITLLVLGLLSLCTACSNFEKIGQSLSDKQLGEFMGFATAINADGSIIAVGAPFGERKLLGSGKVQVYKLNNNTWTAIGSSLFGNSIGAHFGKVIALNSAGNIMAVSAPNSSHSKVQSGAVHVYQWKNERWQSLGKPLHGSQAYERFGSSMDLSDDGTVLAIGSPPNPKELHDKGKVYVFTLKEQNWIPLGSTIRGRSFPTKKYFSSASIETQHIGTQLSLSGDGKTMTVGSAESTVILKYSDYIDTIQSSSESVTAFRLKNNEWRPLGDILFPNEKTSMGFAKTTSINYDGTIIAVGSSDGTEYKYTENGKDVFFGEVNTFQLTENQEWKPLGNRLQGQKSDRFGSRFTLNAKGNRMLVTGDGYDPDDGPGDMNYVYLFGLKDNDWILLGDKLKMEQAFEDFDMSIALDEKGNTIVIGNSPMNEDGLTFGEVLVFKYEAK